MKLWLRAAITVAAAAVLMQAFVPVHVVRARVISIAVIAVLLGVAQVPFIASGRSSGGGRRKQNRQRRQAPWSRYYQ